MSAVQVHFPANPLAAALRAAKPRTALAGLRDAEANLAGLRDQCLQALDERLAALDQTFAAWPSAQDEAMLDALYNQTVAMVGVAGVAGFGALEKVAVSLCDVLDGLKEKRLWERAPVAVHLSALRLLREGGQDEAATSSMMDGLGRVRAIFAAPAA